jgi:hypothetical protein
MSIFANIVKPRTSAAWLSIAYLLSLLPCCPASAAYPERLIVGKHFTASPRQAAFSVRDENDIVVLVVDLESGSVTKLRSTGTRLIFPFLSPDGARLLLVRQHPDSGESDLLSCTTARFDCRHLLTLRDAISCPVEFDDRRILFISSAIRSGGPNLRSRYLGVDVNRYVRHDIWRLDIGQPPIRITDFQLYELHDLSVTAGRVFFSGMGPRRNKPVIPNYEPLQRPASEIFWLPFDRTDGSLSLPETQLSPIFVEEGYTYSANMAFDESIAALIRTTTSHAYYRYDLVVRDLTTKSNRTIEPIGLGFSRSVVVGHTVLVNEIFDSGYLIRKLLPGDGSLRSVVDLTNKSIASVSPTEITVEQEAR